MSGGGAPPVEPGGDVLLVATRNPDKLREIRELLEEYRLTPTSVAELGLEELPEEAELERFPTFARNALAKARHFHARASLPVLADDSGLCVDALDGAPGVRTRRFAPEALARRMGRDAANNAYLLERLEGVAEEARTARYRCAVAALDAAGRETVVEGTVEGRIGRAPRGAGGFGYDPLFVPRGHARTYAELPEDAKRATSHRAWALEALRPWLERRGTRAGNTTGGDR